MQRRITFSVHALETVELGCQSQKRHRSDKHKTYQTYYSDGLCFYVICHQKQSAELEKIRVVTIIIEEGRP